MISQRKDKVNLEIWHKNKTGSGLLRTKWLEDSAKETGTSCEKITVSVQDKQQVTRQHQRSSSMLALKTLNTISYPFILEYLSRFLNK